MTINAPVIQGVDLTNFPGLYDVLPDVQPFTMRSGSGYQETLEGIIRWIRGPLNTYLAALNTGNDDVIDEVTEALAAQSTSVTAQVTAILNQVVAGANVSVNDGAMLAALSSANSVALAFLSSRYGKVLAGAGIDPTGAAVSTAAVQAFLATCNAGDTVVVPNGAVIALDGTLTVTKRLRFTGSGELRWVAGIASAALIDVQADGCDFTGLYITNPNHLAAQTGNRTTGITFHASHGRVTNCRIVGQQQAIFVDANGEWHDFVFSNNDIVDVPGSGDGINNNSSNGEDRGDGIYVMGATATITGNRVAALANTDGRIGIGVEGLPTYEVTPYQHGDSMCTITGNVVTGKFRRGIASEGVANCSITGNTVADATWWGIAVSNTSANNIVADNVVNVSSATTDNQGSAWSPSRCGIMIYDQVQNAIVKGNVVVFTGSLVASGIVLQVGSGGNSSHVAILNNIVDGGSFHLAQNGIIINNGSNDTMICGNRVLNFTAAGIWLNQAIDPKVFDNTLIGNGSGAGVHAEGSPASGGRFDHNTVVNVSVAFALFMRTSLFTFIGNMVKTAQTGLDMYSATAPLLYTIALNTMLAVSTEYANVPTGSGFTANNVNNV